MTTSEKPFPLCVPTWPHLVGTDIKVVGFPGGEAMWVTIVSGSETDGSGTLANDPYFSDLKYGDLVTYIHGTPENRPKFKAKISA